MADEKWEVAGYIFASKQDFEKAKKEADSIAYIKQRTDWKDKQQVLKLYNKAVDCKMFQTVLGYEFMHQLQSIVAKSGIIEEGYLKAIPICKQGSGTQLPENAEEAVKLAKQYQSLYEVTKEEKKRLKIVVGFLVFTVCLMMVLAYTNYRTYDESAVLDKYSGWASELKQREAVIKEKEKELEIDTNNSK